MMTPIKLYILMILSLLMSCSLKGDLEESLHLDYSPPLLRQIQQGEEERITIRFDEDIEIRENQAQLDSGDLVNLSIQNSSELIIDPDIELIAGKEYSLSLSIYDRVGNGSHYILPLWGWNHQLPHMLINELNPQGSTSNPDTIELIALEAGNICGAYVCIGSRLNSDAGFTLPSIDVEEGDFIIIHCQKATTNSEVNEVSGDKTLSDGNMSHDSAWDIWPTEDMSLSGSNGSVALYRSPGGGIIDCVIYSSRSSDINDKYLGWTSATFDAVCDLYDREAWIFQNENLAPEEAVSSQYTTATRSLCRRVNSEDSNTSEDWYTVVTSGKTFGTPNTSAEYSP